MSVTASHAVGRSVAGRLRPPTWLSSTPASTPSMPPGRPRRRSQSAPIASPASEPTRRCARRQRCQDAGHRRGRAAAAARIQRRHVHLDRRRRRAVGVDLRPRGRRAGLRQAARRLRRTQPKGRWILGGFWDHEAWPSRVAPDARPDRQRHADNPVFVQRLDGHMALANAVALRLAGIRPIPRRPMAAPIVRDGSGQPTGIFKDNAMDLVTRAIAAATLDADHGQGEGGATARRLARCDDNAGHDGERRPSCAPTRSCARRGELTARIYFDSESRR